MFDRRFSLPLVLALFAVLPTFGQLVQNYPYNQPHDQNLQIFLMGTVLAEDGTQLPVSAALSIACNGGSQLRGYTDPTGGFNLAFSSSTGNSSGIMAMPSDTSFAPDISTLQLCSLKVDAPGYRVQNVSLAGLVGESGPVSLGRITLHRLQAADGFTVSASDLSAPKQAQKNYNKGIQAARKGLWAAAREKFETAVKLYPRYAMAWLELGKVQAQESNFVDAQNSFHEALQANGKLGEAYLQLAQLAARQERWQDLADTTDNLLAMNPAGIARVWFLNAVANFNLHHFDRAETSVLRSLNFDSQHRIPRAEYLLGLILAVKHEYKAAAQHIQNYLSASHSSPQTAEAERQLAEINKLAEPAAASAPGGTNSGK